MHDIPEFPLRFCVLEGHDTSLTKQTILEEILVWKTIRFFTQNLQIRL